MLVKFTNAFPGREGDPIYVNPNFVKCVYEDKTPTLQTKIACQDVLWTVEEGLTEAVKKLDDALKKSCSC